MNYWSRSSANNLKTCNVTIQTIFNVVLQRHDCACIHGRRGEVLQNQLFDSKVSKKRFPDSKHNTSPLSEAGDFIPVVPNVGRIVGNKKKDLKYFYVFAGIVKATMLNLYEEGKIKSLLRWGGDWDQDGDMDDQNFNDLYHWETVDAVAHLTKMKLEVEVHNEAHGRRVDAMVAMGSTNHDKETPYVDKNERYDW